MKKTFSSFALLIFLSFSSKAQNILYQAPQGFDSLRANIPRGKIDTVTYDSKTVGTKRKTLIYTPPNFSKSKKVTPFKYSFKIFDAVSNEARKVPNANFLDGFEETFKDLFAC